MIIKNSDDNFKGKIEREKWKAIYNRVETKKGFSIEKPFFLMWRRRRDLNSRRAINPRWFSRPVHSAALPPLRRTRRIINKLKKKPSLFLIYFQLSLNKINFSHLSYSTFNSKAITFTISSQVYKC